MGTNQLIGQQVEGALRRTGKGWGQVSQATKSLVFQTDLENTPTLDIVTYEQSGQLSRNDQPGWLLWGLGRAFPIGF